MALPGSISTFPDTDPDPDPTKWYGSDRIQIRIRNTALNTQLPILKNEYFHLWFLYKSYSCISCFRNDGKIFIPLIYHIKKYFKILLFTLAEIISLKKALINTKGENRFNIKIYVMKPMKIYIFFKKRFHLYFSPLEAYTTVLGGSDWWIHLRKLHK